MDLLPHLWNVFKKESKNIKSERLKLRGIWNIDLYFNPKEERFFKYNVLLTLIEKHGCCYSNEKNKLTNLDYFIGKKIIDLSNLKLKRDLSIAILDAGFGSIINKPIKKYILNPQKIIKSKKRAEIICNEIQKVTNNKHPKIGIIGTTKSIIKEVLDRNWKCRSSDMDLNIIGKNFYGILIENHKNNYNIIDESDAIIVTGMTIATKTLGDIIEIKNQLNKKMVIFAETGSNFSFEYLKLGVDAVIAEPFPFYIFNIPSEVRVYRREQL